MKNNPLVQNNALILICGHSGSGKSTFADFLEFMIDGCEVEICTADDYHMVDGEYKFDVNKLGAAHKWCQERADSYMRHNTRIVIVNNTSTTQKERQVYIDMAEKHGYEVVQLFMGGSFDNVHGVPDEVVKKQKEKLVNSLKGN